MQAAALYQIQYMVAGGRLLAEKLPAQQKQQHRKDMAA
jgi:hypothetical protein